MLWAGLYHVAHSLAAVADLYVIAFIRYLIAAVLLLVVLRMRTGEFIPRLNLQQWLSISGLGLIGVCAYNVLFFSAEALVSGDVVAIFYSFTPCITTIISAYVFKTKLNYLSKVGLAIALIGSIGVVNYATPGCQQFFCTTIFNDLGRGQIYGILATLIFACYSVLSRYTAQQKISGLVMNSYASIIGAVFLGIIAYVKGDFSQVTALGINCWLGLGYMSVLATVVAYLWYTDAIIHLGVFKTVVFQNTIPLQAIVIGYIGFKEKISFGALICGLVVLCGVYLTNIALTFRHKLK